MFKSQETYVARTLVRFLQLTFPAMVFMLLHLKYNQVTLLSLARRGQFGPRIQESGMQDLGSRQLKGQSRDPKEPLHRTGSHGWSFPRKLSQEHWAFLCLSSCSGSRLGMEMGVRRSTAAGHESETGSPHPTPPPPWCLAHFEALQRQLSLFRVTYILNPQGTR